MTRKIKGLGGLGYCGFFEKYASLKALCQHFASFLKHRYYLFVYYCSGKTPNID